MDQKLDDGVGAENPAKRDPKVKPVEVMQAEYTEELSAKVIEKKTAQATEDNLAQVKEDNSTQQIAEENPDQVTEENPDQVTEENPDQVMEENLDDIVSQQKRSKSENETIDLDTEKVSNPRELGSVSDGTTRDMSKETKTILILGKTGAGKVDVAKHIFKESNERFPCHSSVDSAMRCASTSLHDSIHETILSNTGDKVELIRVVITDTNGLSVANYTKSEISQKLQNIGQVNTIFFVMKYGRVTEEDCKPLDVILDNIINDDISKICYLVVTGCEGLKDNAREKIIAMYKEDTLTSRICFFVKDIILVGFPDLETVQLEFHPIYQKGIERDKANLQNIVKESDNPYLLSMNVKANSGGIKGIFNYFRGNP